MSTSQPTVLIAEDDTVFRRVICFTLDRLPIDLVAVGDGAAAWQRLQQGGVDFLVTDQQMPAMTGLELLEQKHLDPQFASIPAILCTAKGFELDTEGLKAHYGLIDVMHKPFSPRKLAEVIVKHLEQSSVCGGA